MSKERKLSVLDRVVHQLMGNGERSLGNAEDPARESLPNLWEWLSRINVGRDLLKAPAVLTIRLGPECAIASLTDRDLAVSLDAPTPYLAGALEALERELSCAQLALKSWGKKEPQLRKRRPTN